MTHYSDEDLTAYLDGEADGGLVREIETARTANPELEQRLAELELDRGVITDAFAGLLHAAPEPPELPDGAHPLASSAMRPASPAGGASRWLGIAASIVLMIAAAGGGYLYSESRTLGWRGYVAAYQALYVNGTLAHMQPSPEEQGVELERAGKAIGKAFDLGTLTQLSLLDYKRAQTLGFKGKPLVQLAFLSKLGAPIALCVIRSKKGAAAQKEIQFETLEGLRAAHWADGGFSYLLIGGTDAELIDAAARYFAGKV